VLVPTKTFDLAKSVLIEKIKIEEFYFLRDYSVESTNVYLVFIKRKTNDNHDELCYECYDVEDNRYIKYPIADYSYFYDFIELKVILNSNNKEDNKKT
jgi:hypothetical protein